MITLQHHQDAWFRPTASREEVPALLRNADVGDFVVRWAVVLALFVCVLIELNYEKRVFPLSIKG